MKLRQRTLIVVCLTVSILFAVIYMTSQSILTRSFDELEEKNTSENVERAESAITGEVSDMDTFLHDWSAWDDSYAFVQDGNEAYVESNLIDETFINSKLNLIVFVNSSGQFIFAKAFDYENRVEVELPQSFTESLSTQSLFWLHTDTAAHVGGIVLLQEGPMLVVSRPIVTSQSEGPIQGALIMGRNLDAAEIGKLSDKTHLPLLVQRFDSSQLPSDFQSALSSLSDQKPIVVKPLNSSSVAGYVLMRDVYGNPGVILRIELPRDISKQGYLSISYFLVSLVVAGAVFCAVIVLLLEKLVLSRLAQLGTTVRNISKGADLSMRVRVEGKDELSDLSIEFNKMLSALETSRSELRKYSDHLEELVEERTADLRKSEEKLKSIFAASPDAITATDLNGSIIECNEKTVKMHGYSSKEELIGKNAFALIAKKDHQKAMEKLKKTLKQQSTKSLEYTFVSKNGREFPAELSVSTVRDATGKPIGFVAVTKDITERKQMEMQLFKSERLAAIGQLASMVGHDLRNPLTGITGAIYYLKKCLRSKLNRKESGMVELIENAIEHSNKIINDLLEYSREVKLELTQTDPKSMLRETLSLIEIPENIRLLDETCTEPKMKVDIEKMRRVFINVIRNAIDAMPKGGTLKISNSLNGDPVEISFSDTGLGISKEDMNKIWTPLFTTKAKGMGFGLAICKRIIEAHGGRISIESKFRRGTRVTMTVPLEPRVELEAILSMSEPTLPTPTNA